MLYRAHYTGNNLTTNLTQKNQFILQLISTIKFIVFLCELYHVPDLYSLLLSSESFILPSVI
jgi:hypothetical protein